MNNLTEFDPKNSIAMYSQLDLWELLVQIMNPDSNPNPNSENSFLMISQATDFLNLIFHKDHQISDFLLNSTDLFIYVLKWLKNMIKNIESTGNNEAINETLESILNFVATSFELNEDLCFLFLNKTFLAKQKKSMSENKFSGFINIYKTFSFLLNNTDAYTLILSIQRIIILITPKWPYASNILSSLNENEEIIGEQLVLSLAANFKKLFTELKEKKINPEQFFQKKSILLICLASLLMVDQNCKNTFVLSGFFNEIVKEFERKIDELLIDEKEISSNKNKERFTVKQLFSKNIEKEYPQDEALLFIKIAKSLFYEKENSSKNTQIIGILNIYYFYDLCFIRKNKGKFFFFFDSFQIESGFTSKRCSLKH
jgi:hypothetical protein